jgi:hypothetical protein
MQAAGQQGESMMAISVMVPLHSDLTAFDADAVWSEALDAAIDAVSLGLGARLGEAASEWPELRQLYVDCVMLDSTNLSGQPARFEKKSGQFNIGCTADCSALVGVAVEVQAASIFDVVCQASAGAFAKRKMPALAAACEAFRAGLNPDFVRECIASAPASEDVQIEAFDPLPRDADGRCRHVRELQNEPGELWLMACPYEGEVDVAQVMAQIESFLEDGRWGVSTGSSVGEAAFDLSFEVDDLEAAGHALDGFLRTHLPRLDFLISDDYEPQMDGAARD